MKPSYDNFKSTHDKDNDNVDKYCYEDKKWSSSVHYDVRSSSGVSSNGKWSIVVIILAILHLVTFTWMITLESQNRALTTEVQELRIKQSYYYEDVEDEDGGNVRRRRAEIFKTCQRFRSKLARCKAPSFARQYTNPPPNIIQLYGTGDEVLFTAYETIVKSWKLDMVQSGSNGLVYTNDGCIKIKKNGFYYIYAQMRPANWAKDKKIQKAWEFKIFLNDEPIAIASLSLPGCNVFNCSKSTMFTSRIVKLNNEDSLSIKVSKGTWYANQYMQIFGAYFLGSSSS